MQQGSEIVFGLISEAFVACVLSLGGSDACLTHAKFM